MAINPMLLREVDLFADMADEHLAVVVRNLRPLHVDAGEVLVSEGQKTKGPLYVVTDGALEVSRRDAKGEKCVLTTLQPPTVIGEMEFLADVRCSATVTAAGEVRGWLLARELFEKLVEAGDPAALQLALQIGRLVSERLAETNRLLTTALADRPREATAVQRAQLSGADLSGVDSELDALLER